MGSSFPLKMFLFPVFVLAILLFGLATNAAAGDGFYQWTTESGTISFTDDEKQIPRRYQEQAAQRSWEELRAGTDSKVTPQSTSHPVPVWDYQPDAKPERPNCEGPVTITRTRIQYGDYNREMFVARDECGEIISITSQRPLLDINR